IKHPTSTYNSTLSLHDALPILKKLIVALMLMGGFAGTLHAQVPENTTVKVGQKAPELKFENPEGKMIELSKIAKDHVVLVDFWRSEEHTSELQSRENLVCRLLL